MWKKFLPEQMKKELFDVDVVIKSFLKGGKGSLQMICLTAKLSHCRISEPLRSQCHTRLLMDTLAVRPETEIFQLQVSVIKP